MEKEAGKVEASPFERRVEDALHKHLQYPIWNVGVVEVDVGVGWAVGGWGWAVGGWE